MPEVTPGAGMVGMSLGFLLLSPWLLHCTPTLSALLRMLVRLHHEMHSVQRREGTGALNTSSAWAESAVGPL